MRTPLAQCVVLCEGGGDESFFRHLLTQRCLPHFAIVYPNPERETGGRHGFSDRLRAMRAEPEFDKVAGILVVSDNDDDSEASFRAVQEQLRRADYGVPERPLEVARTAGGPAVVVMMVPWVGELGNLESLCLISMYDRWPALRRCVDAFCECCGTHLWGVSKQSKMRLRSLISAACTSDPNTSLVYAWSNRGDLIPLGHPCFDRIADFLGGLGALVGTP